ncbi:MAG: LPS export ABC transporter periplasmic protein LptC [Stellaceae bacterium]
MRPLGYPTERGPAVGLTSASQTARDWRPQRLADRYSRRVAILKRILPVIGVALLLLVAAWPRLAPLLDSVRLGFPGIDLREARELKMLNPRYAGVDRYNRPFVMTAAVGRQVPNHNNLLSLEQPRAELTVHGGAKITLAAATGIYQSQAQLLDLFGEVTLIHQNGTRFVTRQAHADFSDNTAEGHDPIVGNGPSGEIWGQGFRILDKGDSIVFTGRSHLVLKGGRPGRAATPTAALPPAIVDAAARIAAAAAASPASGPAFPRIAAAAKPTAHRAAAKRRLAASTSANGERARAPARPRRGSSANRKTRPPIGPAAGKTGRHAG